MRNVTELLQGKNGNGGKYYDDLPRGNEIFHIEEKKAEVKHHKLNKHWTAEIGKERLERLAAKLSEDTGYKGHMIKVAKLMQIRINILYQIKSRNWSHVSRENFLRVEREFFPEQK